MGASQTAGGAPHRTPHDYYPAARRSKRLHPPVKLESAEHGASYDSAVHPLNERARAIFLPNRPNLMGLRSMANEPTPKPPVFATKQTQFALARVRHNRP